MGNEVFVCAVTLYGKARVQYVVNSGGIVALACQIGTFVTGRVGYGSRSIGQVALHIGQSGRLGGVAGRILHAGNHVTGRNSGTCAVRLGVEVAISVFVHFVAVAFGIRQRSLRILYYSLGIQCVGVGLVATGSVHFLFDSQTVTCGKGDFLARFNGSRCGAGTSGQSAAGCGLEAAVVDGVGNVTGCRQFTCVGSSWRGNFTVGHCQRSGGYGLSSNLICHSFQLRNVYRIRIFRTSGHINDLTGTILRTNRYCTQLTFYCSCNIVLIRIRS